MRGKWRRCETVRNLIFINLYLTYCKTDLVPRDAQVCAVDLPKTTLCQFWKFIQTHEEGKVLFLSDAISKTRLRAFVAFCEHKGLLPASIISKVNHLKQFLNWLKSRPAFQPKERHIERCLETLRNRMQGLNAANDTHRDQNHNGESNDLLIGEEIVQLNNKCNRQILSIINTINKRELARTKLKAPKTIAYEFQTCLQFNFY